VTESANFGVASYDPVFRSCARDRERQSELLASRRQSFAWAQIVRRRTAFWARSFASLTSRK
jgi:hypothetical protein